MYKLTPAGNYEYGDLHEFKLTESGTALITIYEVVPKSLASIGGEREDRLFDNIFQEIDIATGELIFEWRASRHVDWEYSYLSVNYRHPDGESDAAYDAFHLNSVDKTPEGNYLISLRHMCAIYLVDGTTGSILWTLGGKRNQFTDLRSPLGSATSFHFQHHARMHAGGDVLTLFDNNGYDYNHITAPYARGMRLHLDTTTTRLTANLTQTYIDPQRTSSYSQGSLQYDADRDMAITSHGHAASWTEFHAGTGAVVCDVHFGASILFDFSLVNSYRVFKRGWVGRPRTGPEVRPNGGRVYVSWNGATEIRGWGLQGAGAGAAATTTTTTRRTPKGTPGAGGGVVEGDDDEKALDDAQWKTLEIIPKTGFEDSFTIPPAVPPAATHRDGAYLRVVALDSEGAVLGTSRALSRREVEDGASGAPGFLGVLAWAAGGTVVVVCCVRGWRGISGGDGGRGRVMRGRWWR